MLRNMMLQAKADDQKNSFDEKMQLKCLHLQIRDHYSFLTILMNSLKLQRISLMTASKALLLARTPRWYVVSLSNNFEAIFFFLTYPSTQCEAKIFWAISRLTPL